MNKQIGLVIFLFSFCLSAQAAEEKAEPKEEANPFLEHVFISPDEYEKDPPISGKMAGDNCSACHGTQGRVFNEGIPPIAGLPKDKFVKLMMDFKAGKEKTIVMHWVARAFTDGEIERMGDYFSSIPATPWLEPAMKTTDEQKGEDNKDAEGAKK